MYCSFQRRIQRKKVDINEIFREGKESGQNTGSYACFFLFDSRVLNSLFVSNTRILFFALFPCLIYSLWLAPSLTFQMEDVAQE